MSRMWEPMLLVVSVMMLMIYGQDVEITQETLESLNNVTVGLDVK